MMLWNSFAATCLDRVRIKVRVRGVGLPPMNVLGWALGIHGNLALYEFRLLSC